MRTQRVGQAQFQRQGAIVCQLRLARLIPGRFVAAAQDTELIGSPSAPVGPPLRMIRIAVCGEVELSMERAFAAETEANDPGLLVGNQGSVSVLQALQPALFLVHFGGVPTTLDEAVDDLGHPDFPVDGNR